MSNLKRAGMRQTLGSRRGLLIVLALLLCVISQAASNPPSATPSPSLAPAPPRISQLLKPTVYRRVTDEREVMVQAKLEDVPESPQRRYGFYATMLVRAEPSLTRSLLTDYRLYAKMIPYIEKADYTAATQTLRIEGGIWKFKLASWIRFEEKNDGWIRYAIVGGHFTGLSGDILFERFGEKSTTVHVRGEQVAMAWPPKFVIEQGAEIVFGFTAKRMRSYIESQKKGDRNP